MSAVAALGLLLASLIIPSALGTYTCRERASPPEGAICRQHGSVSTAVSLPNPISVVDSFEHCRHLAFQKTTGFGAYKSFSWNSNNKHCHFYTNTLVNASFVPDPTRTAEFSDLACTKCKIVCPAPHGTNLIANPGFESSPKYIGPWEPSVAGHRFTAVSPGNKSPTALRMPVSEAGFELDQALSFLCNADFFFTMDYKFTEVDTLQIYYQVKIGTLLNTVASPKQQNSTWTTYENYFSYSSSHPDASTLLHLLVGNYNQTTTHWLLDNFGIYQAQAPVIKPGARQKLGNAGFESGSFAPWETFDTTEFSLASPGLHGSKYALNVTLDGSSRPEDAYFTQNVSLTPGAHYLLSFDYYVAADVKPARAPALDVDVISGDLFYDSSYAFLRGPVFDKIGYGCFQRRFVASSTAAETVIQLDFYSTYDSEGRPFPSVLVDNFSLKEIERPKVS